MVEGQTISGDAEGSRKDDRLSASAKPFRPSALVIDGDDEGDETGNQYKTPRSSVMVRAVWISYLHIVRGACAGAVGGWLASGSSNPSDIPTPVADSALY